LDAELRLPPAFSPFARTISATWGRGGCSSANGLPLDKVPAFSPASKSVPAYSHTPTPLPPNTKPPQGILHGDLTSANVLLTTSPEEERNDPRGFVAKVGGRRRWGCNMRFWWVRVCAHPARICTRVRTQHARAHTLTHIHTRAHTHTPHARACART
jgi:hypothetical protein